MKRHHELNFRPNGDTERQSYVRFFGLKLFRKIKVDKCHAEGHSIAKGFRHYIVSEDDTSDRGQWMRARNKATRKAYLDDCKKRNVKPLDNPPDCAL